MPAAKPKQQNTHGHADSKKTMSMMPALNIDFQVITAHDHEQELHKTLGNC